MNLAQVDLNLLVAVDALLRERNVTRAGKRIGLSQPAMSAVLARVRDLFGDELLVRVGREYQLTPVAAGLTEPVQEILAQVERTLRGRGPFEPGTARRQFTIAVSDYAVVVMMQPLLERLAEVAPGVSLRFLPLREDTPGLLRSRKVDVAIVPAGGLDGFPSEALFRDTWACAVWAGNREVGAKLRRPDLDTARWVKFTIGPAGPSVADRQLDSLGIDRRVDVITESFASSLLLLRRTHLMTIVPRRLGRRLRKAAEIRLLTPPVAIPDLVEAMWWNPIDTDDAPHSWLRGLLREVAAGI